MISLSALLQFSCLQQFGPLVFLTTLFSRSRAPKATVPVAPLGLCGSDHMVRGVSDSGHRM